MKYIVTKTDEGKKEIFLFSDDINHDTMAEAVSYIRNQTHRPWHRVAREPISAGFIEGGKCVGGSETLKLKSNPEDTQLLSQ